jgi:long-chain acyl-CoA synthetase
MNTLPGSLRRAAERSPDHPAFITQQRVVTTYAELATAAARIATGLGRLGVASGDRVALLLDGGAEYIAAYYGIIGAGAVVVPLSSDTRTRSLVYALAHCEAKAALLDAKNLQYLSGQAAALPALRALIYRGEARIAAAALRERGHFELEGYDALLAAEPAAPRADDPEELASIIYTSGTTGKPKGVMLTHANLAHNTSSIVQYLELSASDRVAMVLPFHYAYGNSVLHTHLSVGATIVAAGSMTFPMQVLESIAAARCTGFPGVPSTFARLTSLSGVEAYDLSCLRYVTQAGAAMTPALTEKLHALIPSARIFVMYGQTEASARLAYLPPEKLSEKLGSAGKAIPGVTLEVVGADGAPLPARATGEIVARGGNIMRGYWRDPEQTAKVLRPSGLHTGDLGWLDEDGFLYIVGRESEMIKSGAHRISPREIEDVIEAIDGVRECAVVGVPDEQLGQAILAVVAPRDGVEIDRQRLMRTCLEELPRYKLPAHVLTVPALPRTPAGKVARADLLELWRQSSAEAAPVRSGA